MFFRLPPHFPGFVADSPAFPLGTATVPSRNVRRFDGFGKAEGAARQPLPDDKGKTKRLGPTHSEVMDELRAVEPTYQQLTNRMKLDELVIGPFRDE
jgi:hypothetical protein